MCQKDNFSKSLALLIMLLPKSIYGDIFETSYSKSKKSMKLGLTLLIP